MFKLLTTSDIAYLYFLVLAMLVVIIHAFHRRRILAFTAPLVIAYTMLIIIFFFIFLARTKLMLYVPHLYRTTPILILLYMPLSYLFLRTTLTGKRPIVSDGLHALPALVYIADYLPFFLSSSHYKFELLNDLFTNPGLAADFSQGIFLSSRFHGFMISISPVAYWLMQVAMLRKFSHSNSSFLQTSNRYGIKWTLFYLMFQLMTFLPVLLILLWSDPGYLFPNAHIFAITSTAFMIISLFAYPETLMEKPNCMVHTNGDEVVQPNMEMGGIFQDNCTHNTMEMAMGLDVLEAVNTRRMLILKNLSEDQIALIKRQIHTEFEHHRPFLKHGYSLQEMATSLSLPFYKLSGLLNQEYKLNFNDFINKHRIEHAVTLIKQGKNVDLNISGLADECGFNNRNSFTAAFKKFTGFTPSEYFKFQNI